MPTTLFFAPEIAAPKGPGTYPTLATNYANLTPTAAVTTEGRMLPYKYNTAANLSTSSTASTSAQSRRFGRFFSPPFETDFTYTHPTSAGQEILFYGADYQSNASANHCIQQCCIYVWRPSTGAVVGYIQQAAVLATGTKEPSATSTSQNTLGTYLTTAGSIAILAGDILVFEPWSTFTQGAATAYTIRFYYGGATDISVENTTNSTPASRVVFQHVTLPLRSPLSAATGMITLAGTVALVPTRFQSSLLVPSRVVGTLTDGSYLQASLSAEPNLLTTLDTAPRFASALRSQSRVVAHLRDTHSLHSQLRASSGASSTFQKGRVAPYLALYYTGGGSPSTPASSIGGPISAYPVKGGKVTPVTNMAGLSVVGAIGLAAGLYDIEVIPALSTIVLTMNNGTLRSTATFKNNGDVILVGLPKNGFAVVEVSSIAALQAGSIRFYVEAASNGLFSNLSAASLSTGRTVYRAVFLFNKSSQEATNVKVTVGDISGETVEVGLEAEADISMNGVWPLSRISASVDPTGWGGVMLADGIVQYDMRLELDNLPVITSDFPAEQSSTGASSYPLQLVDEFDSTSLLASVVFKPSIQWSKIAPGRGVSFWIRKTTPQGISKPYVNDVDLIIESTS